MSKNDPKIKELLNENKLLREYNNFSEGEKLILIKFSSNEQNIDYSLIAKNTEKFSNVEAKLYDKYQQLKSENYSFSKDGVNINININKTLEENKINHNDVIILKK